MIARLKEAELVVGFHVRRFDHAVLHGPHRHAEAHGHLCFRTRSGDRVQISARWPARELVEQSWAAAR